MPIDTMSVDELQERIGCSRPRSRGSKEAIAARQKTQERGGVAVQVLSLGRAVVPPRCHPGESRDPALIALDGIGSRLSPVVTTA